MNNELWIAITNIFGRVNDLEEEIEALKKEVTALKNVEAMRWKGGVVSEPNDWKNGIVGELVETKVEDIKYV